MMAVDKNSDSGDIPLLVTVQPATKEIIANENENVANNSQKDASLIAEDEDSENEDIPKLVCVQPPAVENLIPNKEENIAINNNTKSDENNERHKLLLRREARKKKILENAKDRLAKLNGREAQQSHGVAMTAHVEDVSDPEVEPDIPELMRAENFNVHNQPENMQDLDFSTFLGRPPNQTPNMPDLNFSTFSGGPINQTPTGAAKPSQFWQKSRLHVILVALLTCVLQVLGYNLTMGMSIFALFGLCIASELLFFTRQRELDPMVNLLIMFSGIPPRVTKDLMNFVLILYNVLTDMAIFLFCLCSFLISYKTIMSNNDALGLIEIK